MSNITAEKKNALAMEITTLADRMFVYGWRAMWAKTAVIAVGLLAGFAVMFGFVAFPIALLGGIVIALLLALQLPLWGYKIRLMHKKRQLLKK